MTTCVCLMIVMILLTLFNTYLAALNRFSILEIRDRLGFGVTTTIDQIPAVMEKIHKKVQRGRDARRDRNRELLEELAHLDDSVA